MTRRPQLFSRHSRDIAKLVLRLEKKPRHSKVEPEMAVIWPGTDSIACKPDVLTYTPDPMNEGKTYLTYWEVSTNNRFDGGKMYRQANAWYRVMEKHGNPEYTPRFVYVNSKLGIIKRVRND